MICPTFGVRSKDSDWYNSDFVSISAVTLNISGDANFDSQINGLDEAWKDCSPYGVLVRNNNNDDDHDGQPDNTDEIINGSNDAVDLEPLRLSATYVPWPYTLRLRLTDPVVRIFSSDDPQTAVPILGPGRLTFNIPRKAVDAGPDGFSMETLGTHNMLYAEGIVTDGSARVLFEIIGPEGTIASDAVRLRVFEFDFDIDAFNDDGYNVPEENLAEDWIEDDPTKPGKIIGINDDDLDGDGIPGFADGFNWSGNSGNVDAASANDKFVPLKLELPPSVDLSVASLWIDYAGSDPADVTHDGTPPAWAPDPNGIIRIWKKNGNQARNKNSAKADTNPGDFVEFGQYDDISKLGFTGTRTVIFYVEGVAPSGSPGDQEIKVYLDPEGRLRPNSPHWMRIRAVRATVAKVNIDVSRMNGTPVPEAQEHSNGSIVQIVPNANPGSLYPNGIFLNIPDISVQPDDDKVKDKLTLKLKKVGPSSCVGKIRVYRKRDTDTDFSIFLDEDETEKALPMSDLSAEWKLDSTVGGVVDLAVIGEIPAGTEICRNTVRISSIPCQPANGRIVFVNPSSRLAGLPYDDFANSAAHTISAAVANIQADDNILITRGSYGELVIDIPIGGVIAGLAGSWTKDDPTINVDPSTTLADAFDFSALPVLSPGQAGTAPIFRSTFAPDANPGGSLLEIAGLKFANGQATTGGAIFVQNLQWLPVRTSYSAFSENKASQFGGAIYFDKVNDAAILACSFLNNIADYNDMSTIEYNKGMGGAVASRDSSLNIEDSILNDNKAQVTLNGSWPTLGSAGGGGDIYVTNGVFTLAHCRSTGAVAGFQRPATDPIDSPGSKYFTGDGGAILIHGTQGNTAPYVEISDSKFISSTAYGNGGAISLSYDCSPEGRGYAIGFSSGLNLPRPTQLGGGCLGTLSHIDFVTCEGGWQGGAVSINGRGMQINVLACNFLSCQAGAIHNRDGKGGGISIGGGVQVALPAENNVSLYNCVIHQCFASGNGGGLYNTIRGNVTIENSTITKCISENRAGSDWAQFEGMGGGIHNSAGGIVNLNDGLLVQTNVAHTSGGGISIKSAIAYLNGTVLIKENTANGNGGGVFVTTSYYDPGVGRYAAMLYEEDGTLISSSEYVNIRDNTAERWGGGLYGGTSFGSSDSALINLTYAALTQNHAKAPISVTGSLSDLFATQIALENLQDGWITRGGVNLDQATIFGNSGLTDIGVYSFHSKPFIGTLNIVVGTLARDVVTQ